MLPQSYQNCFQRQLKAGDYLTLQLLILVLQLHKQVNIEQLATVLPYPILFESRRRCVQRFLILREFKIQTLWFPLIKHFLRINFNKTRIVTLAIDRTQWREQNIFVVSLIWDKRAIPVYWEILQKRGSSNLSEQQALLLPVFRLLKSYKIIVLADREFGSVKLASWLTAKKVNFVLRVKQDRYIKQEKADFQKLSSLGLIPGTSFYLKNIQFTKQQGFGHCDIASYWQRQYQGKGTSAGWYLLTNLGSTKAAVIAYKKRSGIEAMFKDCKTGGYNLEKSYATNQRLISLILLIAIAYTCAILAGKKIKQMGLGKYIGRLNELGRITRRHSSFWVGLYGQLWIPETDVFSSLVTQLMQLRRNKLPYFQRGLRAMSKIQATF